MAPQLGDVDLEKGSSPQDGSESRNVQVVVGDPRISCDGVWTMYNAKAEAYDAILIDRIRTSMDSILVFAGLFSAIVTAFIIEAFQFLNPDPGDTTVSYLAQISQQLAGVSQSNLTLASPITLPPFEPSTSNVVTNVLFVASLISSLTCAFVATLVQSWATRYMRLIHQPTFPIEQARKRSFYFEGLQCSQMQFLAETIPSLLHFALFLFFCGLPPFFVPINHQLALATSEACGICVLTYLIFAIRYVTAANSPNQTLLLSAVLFVVVLVVAIVILFTIGGAFMVSLPVGVTVVIAMMVLFMVTFLFREKFRIWILNVLRPPLSLGTSGSSSNQLLRSHLLRRFQNTPDPLPKQDEVVIKWLLSEIRTVSELEQLVEWIGPLVERQQGEDQQKYAGAILRLGNTLVGNFAASLGLCVGQLLQLCTSPTDFSPEQRRRRVALSTGTLVSIFAHSNPAQRAAAISAGSSSPLLYATPLKEPNGSSCWELWANDITLEALVALRGDPDPDIQLNAVCLVSLLIHRALTDIAVRVEGRKLSIKTPAPWDLRNVVQFLQGERHKALPEVTVVGLLSASMGAFPDPSNTMAPAVSFYPPDNRSKKTQRRLSITVQPRLQPLNDGDFVPFTHEKLRREATLFSLSLLDTILDSDALATPANADVLTRTIRAIAGGEQTAGNVSNEMRNSFQATLRRLNSPPFSSQPRISSVLYRPEVLDILRSVEDSLNVPSTSRAR